MLQYDLLSQKFWGHFGKKQERKGERGYKGVTMISSIVSEKMEKLFGN
jgi:Zn-dependent peptidase ImmA (M78 family)